MTDPGRELISDPKHYGSNPASARSRLVSRLFDYLDQQQVSWVVMNNYEGLPDEIPSDIDMSIAPALFRRLDEFMMSFSENEKSRIIQKLWHGNMKCAYIIATNSNYGEEFVQLDFFTNFSTKGCPSLIEHEALVAGRKAFRNFYVPRPEVELLFNAMRRIFKNDWSDHHCARIAELYQNCSFFEWVPRRYSWMRVTLECAILGNIQALANRRALDWKLLRASARRDLSLFARLDNAYQQARRIFVRLRHETGQLVVLVSPPICLTAGAIKILETVFHRRIILNRQHDPVRPLKLALLKRRKALILLPVWKDNPRSQEIAGRLLRLGLVDQVLHRTDFSEGTRSHAPLLALARTKVPVSEFCDDADAIGNIINIQAIKTANAISCKGTQTSGSANRAAT
jgi:hypothetical protein